MRRDGFTALMQRLEAGWASGDAAAAASCFAPDVEYADPTRYRFRSRDELVPFFEPPPGGHSTVWHRMLFDEEAQTGVVEYTYTGHHRYHGAAFVEVAADGRIARWREYQHLDDERDWASFIAGPGAAGDDEGTG